MRSTVSTAAPTAGTRLRLSIDRLRLPFRSAARQRQMAEALRQELADLLGRSGKALETTPLQRETISLPPIRLSPHSGHRLEPRRLGRRVARRIYHQCLRGGAP